MLTIASLLSLLLFTLHLTDDVVRRKFPAGVGVLDAAIVSGALLYVMLVMAERRSGQVVMLAVSLIAVAMPVMHKRGTGGGAIAKSSGGIFVVLTLLALGATRTCGFILSVRALRSPLADKPR